MKTMARSKAAHCRAIVRENEEEGKGRVEGFFSILPARIIHERRREAAPPGHLASEADTGILAVRRGRRARKALPGERIGRGSRSS